MKYRPFHPSSERHGMFVEAHRCFGVLYGQDYDLLETRLIRAACEAVGVPMGYGRVGKAPTQLYDPPPIFRRPPRL